jgi:hypothetical protein
MKILRIGLIGLVLPLVYACSHPLEIVGEGDVSSNYGRSCTLEDSLTVPVPDNCAKNYVVYNYFDTYTAVPRTGWQFDHWGNYCADAVDNTCTFSFSAEQVRGAWGQTVPPLVAVFNPVSSVCPCIREYPGGESALIADMAIFRAETTIDVTDAQCTSMSNGTHSSSTDEDYYYVLVNPYSNYICIIQHRQLPPSISEDIIHGDLQEIEYAACQGSLEQVKTIDPNGICGDP